MEKETRGMVKTKNEQMTIITGPNGETISFQYGAISTDVDFVKDWISDIDINYLLSMGPITEDLLPGFEGCFLLYGYEEYYHHYFFSINPKFTMSGYCTTLPDPVREELQGLIDRVGYWGFVDWLQHFVDGTRYDPPEQNIIRDIRSSVTNEITTQPGYRFIVP